MKPLKFNTFSIGDTSEMTGVSQKKNPSLGKPRLYP